MYSLNHTILFKFHQHVIQILIEIAGKSFKSKFTAKIDFPIGDFILPIADADIGSLMSLQTLFDKYGDHKLVQFGQHRIVQTIQNFEVFDKNWLTLWQIVGAIFEDLTVNEIVWC